MENSQFCNIWTENSQKKAYLTLSEHQTLRVSIFDERRLSDGRRAAVDKRRKKTYKMHYGITFLRFSSA